MGIKISNPKLTFLKSISAIAFVDDKPDNLIPVAEETDITVIGFMGSGKYPQTRKICRQKGIAIAATSEDLAAILQKV